MSTKVVIVNGKGVELKSEHRFNTAQNSNNVGDGNVFFPVDPRVVGEISVTSSYVDPDVFENNYGRLNTIPNFPCDRNLKVPVSLPAEEWFQKHALPLGGAHLFKTSRVSFAFVHINTSFCSQIEVNLNGFKETAFVMPSNPFFRTSLVPDGIEFPDYWISGISINGVPFAVDFINRKCFIGDKINLSPVTTLGANLDELNHRQNRK
jgi:hypothetical protein